MILVEAGQWQTGFIVPFMLSVQFSCSVVSSSLWPHGLQHTRLPCPLPIPRACSNSCALSRWCHPTISSSLVPLSSHLQSFPASGSSPSALFQSVLRIRRPKYWSFSFSTSPSNEYSGLISFRVDWFDLLAVQEILKTFLQHHSSCKNGHNKGQKQYGPNRSRRN